MAVSTTDATYLNTSTAAAKAATSSTTASPGGTLGKDEFLQLLVKQMEYQDPLDPQDNGEYIAQLANFSSLEQMTNLNDKMEELSSTIDAIGTNATVAQASNLIGKEVTWDVNANLKALGVTNAGETGKEFSSGNVSSVTMKDGIPYLVLEDKTVVALSTVTDIAAGK